MADRLVAAPHQRVAGRKSVVVSPTNRVSRPRGEDRHAEVQVVGPSGHALFPHSVARITASLDKGKILDREAAPPKLKGRCRRRRTDTHSGTPGEVPIAIPTTAGQLSLRKVVDDADVERLSLFMRSTSYPRRGRRLAQDQPDLPGPDQDVHPQGRLRRPSRRRPDRPRLRHRLAPRQARRPHGSSEHDLTFDYAGHLVQLRCTTDAPAREPSTRRPQSRRSSASSRSPKQRRGR